MQIREPGNQNTHISQVTRHETPECERKLLEIWTFSVRTFIKNTHQQVKRREKANTELHACFEKQQNTSIIDTARSILHISG